MSISHPLQHRTLDRRRFLGGSAIAGGVALLGGPVLLGACGDDDTTSAGSSGGGSGSATDLATVFSWVKNVEWAGWWVADSNGYFADNGIAPDFIGGGPNAPEATQVLEAGEAQLGTASDTLQIVDEYGADLGLDLEQSTKENERQIELQKSDLTDEKGLLWMDPEFMAGPVFEGIRATGRDELPEVDVLMDLSFLEEAYDGGTSLLDDGG